MSTEQRLWAPFEDVRTPLHARALVVEQDGRRLALVSMDLLGLSDLSVGGYAAFKARIAAAAGDVVSPEKLILTSTHTHAAPSSLGLTDLYQTPQFEKWLEMLVQQIGSAIRQAAAARVACTLGTASAEVEGLGVYRRFHTTDGIALSHPPPPPETIISRQGPVDNTIRLVAFCDASDRPVALLVNATCHPVYEMCIPHVSADYPGEMSLLLEQHFPGATALFLNGAAGNINPPTVSSGAQEAARHGRRLAETVKELLKSLHFSEDNAVNLARRNVPLPARTITGEPSPVALRAELAALRIGDTAFLFIPGEPFVETGLAVHEASPFRSTFVAGYAEDWIGYIPTDQALDEGGYETGPGAWSRVGYGGELLIRETAIDLLRELNSN